jgi:hypothetical protein
MSNPAPAEEAQPYEAPAIVYEATLEVRAGTPLGLPDPRDPLGLQK